MRALPTAVAGLVLVVVACTGDAGVHGPAARGGPDVLASAAFMKAGKVDMCHREGGGGYHLINISANASDAHVKHGDGVPGAAVPGDASKKFDAACAQVDAVVCPCRFTRDALADLTAAYGDLGSDYDYVSTNLVTQVSTRSNVGDRRLNRFVIFQAPGPDWPQAFMCVTRVYEPEFAILSNDERPVTREEASVCVQDLSALARALGVASP